MGSLMRFAFPAAVMLLCSSTGHAHGLWGHVHVTGWAVENMPDDELRSFLLEPEVFEALLSGAVFTDSGYAQNNDAARAYSEHAHWEPFIEDFVRWIEVNDPPPWDDLESRKRVAFLMGCASHGLQDAIFDTLFLPQLEHHDGVSQDEADPGTDGFLVNDGHIRFVPDVVLPMETLLDLFASLDTEVTEEVINDAVALVTAAYINDQGGTTVASYLGEQYEALMPWGRQHYLDAEIPGSLRAEIYPTMRYQQAIWNRLHGRFSAENALIYAFPETPRRLRSGQVGTADNWVTLIFGAGVIAGTDQIALFDDSNAPVPFALEGNRWGVTPSRIFRVMPSEDLTAAAWYTATIPEGLTLINETVAATAQSVSFQVDCLSPADIRCPHLHDVAVASIDGIPQPPSTPAETGCSTHGRHSPALMLTLLGGMLGLCRRHDVNRASANA